MPEPITPEELEKLEALEKAATPTGWTLCYRGCREDYDVDGPAGQEISGTHRGMFGRKADAELVAAARNALPQLLSLARQAHAQRWRTVAEERPPEGTVILLYVPGGLIAQPIFAIAQGGTWYIEEFFPRECEPADLWQPITLPAALAARQPAEREGK